MVKMQDHITSILGENSELREEARIDRNSLNSANTTIANLEKQLQDSKKNENTRLSNSLFGGYSLFNSSRHTAAVFSRSNYESRKTKEDSRCRHKVHVSEISKAKTCPHCIEKYKEKFLPSAPSGSNPKLFFELLQSGDEVSIARHSK